MIKRLILFILGVLVFSIFSSGAGLKWFKGDLNKALESAKKENKVVMIDFFTNWCTPCKILDKMVWQDEDAVKEISKLNIIPLKLDAEKEGAENAKKYFISAYPTIIFLNNNGEELGRKVGFGSKEDVLSAIKKNAKETQTIKELKEIYSKDPQNLEVAYTLVKKLSETEKEEAKEICKRIYDLDKDNKRGYGSKALIERLMFGFNDLTIQIHNFQNLQYSAKRKAKPIEILWDEEPLRFDDAQNSIEILCKGIVWQKRDEITKALREVETKLKNVDLNIKNYDFDFNPLNDLYSTLYDDEWREAQDAVVDIEMLLSNFMTAQDLNNIAWHNYQTQRKLEESLALSQKSCQLSDDPNLLDTQAHLLMSLGQKEKAIEIEKLAIEKLKKINNKKSIKDFEKEVSLFEKNQLGQLRDNVTPKNSELKRAEE